MKSVGTNCSGWNDGLFFSGLVHTCAKPRRSRLEGGDVVHRPTRGIGGGQYLF